MTFANIDQIRAAKTNDLVAFYNAHVSPDAAVKKFRDRQTAETKAALFLPSQFEAQRLEGLKETFKEQAVSLAEQLSKIETGTEVAANPEAPTDIVTPIEQGPWPFPKGPVEAAPEVAQPAPVAVKPKSANSLGVAASWADPEVAAARTKRHGVTVTFEGATTDYRSVREAFRHFRLPDSKHIKFRLGLKAAGVATFEWPVKGVAKKYEFKLVELSDALAVEKAV